MHLHAHGAQLRGQASLRRRRHSNIASFKSELKSDMQIFFFCRKYVLLLSEKKYLRGSHG